MFNPFKQHRDVMPMVVSVDDEHLDGLLAASKGMQGHQVVEEFVADVRSGKLRMPICADNPEQAARTAAAGVRAKNVIGFGCGVVSPPFQATMIYDPADGPGAGVDAYVAEGIYAGATMSGAQSLLLGHVTVLGDAIWRRLRGLVLVPMKIERASNGDITGELSLHFGWTGTDDIQVRRINTPIRYVGGTLEILPATEVEAPEGEATRLIRAAFELNRLAGTMHAKHKLGG